MKDLNEIEVQDQEDKREAASMDATNHSDKQEHTILQRESDTMEQLGCPSLFYEIQQSLSVHILPPTGHNPATKPLHGPFQFEAACTPFSNEHWEFSAKLNKLYTDMDKWVQVKVHFAMLPQHALYTRALPIYSDAADLKNTVKRLRK